MIEQEEESGEVRRLRKVRRRLYILLTVLGSLCVLVTVGVGLYLYLHQPDAILPEVQMEAGLSVPDSSAWLTEKYRDKKTAELLTDLTGVDVTQPARIPVRLTCGRFEYDSALVIRDTTPPAAVIQDVELWLGQSPEPEDFIVSVSDITDVTVRYGSVKPDPAFVGTQDVTLVLEDEGGNKVPCRASLTITADETAPVIEGVQDQELEEGGTISYKTGVTVTDDRDPKPKLSVNADSVDLDTPGEYEVIYTATDYSGNTSEARAKITVTAKVIGIENIEEMQQLAARIVREECYDGMSDVEKLYTLFWWVKYNMKYVNTSDKTSSINEAIRGFREGYGDCFTYYSVLNALLNAAGFDTMCVQRVGGETQHFWCLVNYHDNWYHIDACPRSADHRKYWYTFLRTDQELRDFSEDIEGYYTFDESLYPRTPEERLRLGDMQGESY